MFHCQKIPLQPVCDSWDKAVPVQLHSLDSLAEMCLSQQKKIAPLSPLHQLSVRHPQFLCGMHDLTVNSFDLAPILLPGEDQAHSANSHGARTPSAANSRGSSLKVIADILKSCHSAVDSVLGRKHPKAAPWMMCSHLSPHLARTCA